MSVEDTLPESTVDVLQPASAQPMSTRQRVALIAMLFAMVLAEELIVRFYRRLAWTAAPA